MKIKLSLLATGLLYVPVVFAQKQPNVVIILADDMGLGKTVQVAVYLRCLHACGQIDSCLIIAPSSVLQVWEDTLNEWTGGHGPMA